MEYFTSKVFSIDDAYSHQIDAWLNGLIIDGQVVIIMNTYIVPIMDKVLVVIRYSVLTELGKRNA